MRREFVVLSFSLLMASVGCKSGAVVNQQSTTTQQTISSIPASPVPQPSTSPALSQQPSPDGQVTKSDSTEQVATSSRSDVCGLISSAEIKSVIGDTVGEATTSARNAEGMAVSQCYYVLPRSGNSVSLQLTEKNQKDTSSRDPSEVWEERFGRFERESGSVSREKDKDNKRGEPKDEEEEGRPPQKIKGVGDDAYWTGNSQIGALYVKRANAFIRISVGGAEELDAKIRKSKALAQRALKRL